MTLRADARRVLIVSPGSLSEQWQDELREKFGLDFELFSREKQEQSPSRNYVAEQERLIELLKEKRQAVISHAVTKGLDPSAPMKDSGVEWLGVCAAEGG
jgi:SNF2 family DNA or RNA helicase